MLLRGTQGQSGLVVPVVKGRSVVKADPAREKLERITSDALSKRDAADARVSATLESARSRVQLLDMLSEAEESGEVSEGFAQRFAHELKKSKSERLARAANPQALTLLQDGADDMERDLHDRALRAEAGARARERIVRIGKIIDDLVAAAQAAPQRFETHYATGRGALAGLPLPAKVVAAFRARLPEIPRAALRALAELDPEAAIDLIERRKGPAHPKFGVSPPVVQMIAKQAQAKLDEDEGARAIDDDVNATRALADREEAVAAYGRGEGTAAALSLRGLDGVGASHLRRLRREGQVVRQQRKRQEASAAGVRKRLAQGLKLDADDEAQAEGLDFVYTRAVAAKRDDEGRGDVAFAVAAGLLPKGLVKKVGELVLSDEAARVVAGVKLIESLERVDPALTKGIDRHVLAEAHEIIDIVESGIDWTEAVGLARESVDVPAVERERRTQQFAEHSDAGWVGRTLDETLGAKIGQVADDAADDRSQQ